MYGGVLNCSIQGVSSSYLRTSRYCGTEMDPSLEEEKTLCCGLLIISSELSEHPISVEFDLASILTQNGTGLYRLCLRNFIKTVRRCFTTRGHRNLEAKKSLMVAAMGPWSFRSFSRFNLGINLFSTKFD